MTARPNIEIALDLRSDEKIVRLGHPVDAKAYPETWVLDVVRPSQMSAVEAHIVPLIDRVDVGPKMLSAIGMRRPRLVAFVPMDLTHEKKMRRMIRATYPFSTVWEHYTDVGKVLAVQDMHGPIYDRDSVVDMRTPGIA